MWGTKKKASSANKPSEALIPDFDLSQFETDSVDIQAILNDESLNQELLELGWQPETASSNPIQTAGKGKVHTTSLPSSPAPAAPAPAPTSSASFSNANQNLLVVDENIPDISRIGLIDESAVVLEEEDLQDPDLLRMYQTLQRGENLILQEKGHREPLSVSDPNPSLSPLPPLSRPILTSQPPSTTVLSGREGGQESVGEDSALNSNVSGNGISVSSFSSMSVEEIKQKALLLKREGKTSEALHHLRYAKQREKEEASRLNLTSSSKSSGSGGALAPPAKPVKRGQEKGVGVSSPLSTVSAAVSTSVSTSASTAAIPPIPHVKGSVEDAFSALERALLEASSLYLSLAKAHRPPKDTQGGTVPPGSAQLALQYMKQYKAYQQELTVLQARRLLPHALPPLFHWESSRREKRIERGEIGENEVRVLITSLVNIDSLLKTHSSREVSVKLTLNIGGKGEEEGGVVTTPRVKYSEGKAEFNHIVTLPILKRSKLTVQAFARKRGQFEVLLHRGGGLGGLLWSTPPLVLCGGTIPLSELLTKIDCEGPFPLVALESDEGMKIKKGQALGGQLVGGVQVRCPLSGPLIEVEEIRKLVLGPWPDVNIIATPISAPTPAPSVPPAPSLPSPALSPGPTSLPAPAPRPVSVHAVSKGGIQLTEREMSDPESVDFIESNDVLEGEIRGVEEGMARGGLEDGDLFASQMRLELLRAKLSLLVYKVQQEELSLGDYLEVVKQRLERDKALALWLKGEGRKEEAVKVMRRMKIMQEEVKNAEEAV